MVFPSVASFHLGDHMCILCVQDLIQLLRSVMVSDAFSLPTPISHQYNNTRISFIGSMCFKVAMVHSKL